MLYNTTENYGAISKGLHWLMAILIFVLIGVGLYMAGLDDDDPSRKQLFFMHKSFGSLVMILLVLRLVWSLMSPPPQPLAALEPKEVLISRGVQVILYLLMLAVPFSGYALSTLNGYPVSFFGLFEMPSLFAKNPEMGELAGEAHEILAWTILGFVGLHVLGALKHRFLGRPEADVLRRML